MKHLTAAIFISHSKAFYFLSGKTYQIVNCESLKPEVDAIKPQRRTVVESSGGAVVAWW